MNIPVTDSTLGLNFALHDGEERWQKHDVLGMMIKAVD